jgi:hypothetical protein
VNVVTEPARVRRRHERSRRLVQAAEQRGDGDQNGCGRCPRLDHRLTRNVAGNELEHVAALLVDAEETRRAVEPDLLQVAEVGSNGARPRSARAADGVADAHQSLRYVTPASGIPSGIRSF